MDIESTINNLKKQKIEWRQTLIINYFSLFDGYTLPSRNIFVFIAKFNPQSSTTLLSL